MQRLMEILRRVTSSSGEAKNPLTAGAAGRKEWQQYEDATAESNGAKVYVCRKAVEVSIPRSGH